MHHQNMDNHYRRPTDFVAHIFQEHGALGRGALRSVEMLLDELVHKFLEALTE